MTTAAPERFAPDHSGKAGEVHRRRPEGGWLVYGDTDVMRRRAGQLREQGVDLRAMADRLVAETEAVGWTGRAAEALAERIRDRAAHLRAVASHHDGAADALEAHLREVDRLKEAIDVAERRSLRTDGEPPTGAVTPPPGHHDWLAVERPGP